MFLRGLVSELKGAFKSNPSWEAAEPEAKPSNTGRPPRPPNESVAKGQDCSSLNSLTSGRSVGPQSFLGAKRLGSVEQDETASKSCPALNIAASGEHIVLCIDELRSVLDLLVSAASKLRGAQEQLHLQEAQAMETDRSSPTPLKLTMPPEVHAAYQKVKEAEGALGGPLGPESKQAAAALQTPRRSAAVLALVYHFSLIHNIMNSCKDPISIVKSVLTEVERARSKVERSLQQQQAKVAEPRAGALRSRSNFLKKESGMALRHSWSGTPSDASRSLQTIPEILV